MAKKIVMLGGRRAGKSSILASVLENLKELSVQDICTVTDGTRYVDWEPGTSLSDKRDELQMYIAYKKAGEEFVVDMNPNRGHASYRVEISRIESGKKIFTQFEFIDVPGEWMKPYGDKKDGSVSAPQNAAEAAGQATMQTAAVTKSNHDQLIDMIGESDVLIVSIDTPYLFASEAVTAAGIPPTIMYSVRRELYWDMRPLSRTAGSEKASARISATSSLYPRAQRYSSKLRGYIIISFSYPTKPPVCSAARKTSHKTNLQI